MARCRCGWTSSTPTGRWSIRSLIEELMQDDAFPDFCRKPVLIIGCGNILFGDDGFGCALAEHLQEHFETPEHVCLADAGTGVRKLLFTLCLSPVRPRRILIMD